MMNLFEIMQAAQGGNAYNNLAQQFGIAPEQAQQAVEAVLPAFSLGLQQQAQSLEGWSNILSSLAQQGGQSAAFFDSDGDGIPDHLEEQGQSALGTMFGSPDVANAVASQAAQFAGLPATMMQQMLPVIATMVLGGLFKGATSSGLGGILGQMMQGGQQAGQGMGGLGNILGGMFGQGMQPQAGQGMGGLFGNILGTMMGGQRQQPQGGLGGMFGGMFGGQPPQPPQSQGADPVNAGLEALRGMFQAGHQVQNTQIDALQQIFAQLNQRR